MSRVRGGGTGRRDAVLAIVLVVGVAVVVASLIGLFGGGQGAEAEFPSRLEVTWTLSPGWEGSAVSPWHGGADGGDLALYLDVSQPMGGFLPPANRGQDFSGFRAVVQLVQDHLVSVAGTAGSRLQWFGLASDAVPFVAPPRLDRRSFNGRETRLDRALGLLTGSLASGRVRAAALISDLNASDGLTGAMGAARPLTAWMASPAVRSGAFHAGLLGVRASYWGVPGSGCPANGELRCWFSERLNAYRPLSRLAQAPFYVLVLGRGREVVEEIGARIKKGAESLGLRPQWELLSAASQARTVTRICKLSEAGHPDIPQLALARDGGGWRCVQGDRVEVRCDLPLEAAIDQPRPMASWRSPGVDLTVAREPQKRGDPGQRLLMTLDCGRLREAPPTGELALRLEGAPLEPAAGPWDEWTSASDEREEDLGRTPQLAYFVDKIRVRPSRLTVVSSPLLRMAGGAPGR